VSHPSIRKAKIAYVGYQPMTQDIQPITEQLLATFSTFAHALAQHYPDRKLHTFNGAVGTLALTF
jgi:hypothetical protein